MEKNAEFNLVKLIYVVVAIVAIPVIFSQVVIRYFYTQWLEPQSTAGTVMMAEAVINKQLDPTKKNILIIGNSRIGEGFSALIANNSVDNSEYNFVSLGLPGTTPRIWFYVLNAIDRDATRFYAVYLMAENYNDTAEENYNDRDVDTAYLSAIFTLKNLLTYPSSFDDSQKAAEAYKSILLPIAPLQKDIIQFLKNPKKRIKQVKQWRKDYVNWTSGYSGRPEHLPQMDTLSNSSAILGQLLDWQKPGMEWYFQAVPKCNQEYLHSFRYNSRWFGDISEHYAKRAVHLGVFMIPRGPYHLQQQCDSQLKGSLAVLQTKKRITTISSEIATALEKPEYFFDHLHINATGRSVFSKNLAIAIVQQLEDQ